jgi:hypothetical protein
MAGITLQIDNNFKAELEHFSWVNWSEIAREEVNKKRIFEDYLKSGEITDHDWQFCEAIDWHPVDQLPLKEEYIRKLKEQEKEEGRRFGSKEEFLCHLENEL